MGGGAISELGSIIAIHQLPWQFGQLPQLGAMNCQLEGQLSLIARAIDCHNSHYCHGSQTIARVMDCHNCGAIESLPPPAIQAHLEGTPAHPLGEGAPSWAKGLGWPWK